jgi:flagellar hook capping protein FlgD
MVVRLFLFHVPAISAINEEQHSQRRSQMPIRGVVICACLVVLMAQVATAGSMPSVALAQGANVLTFVVEDERRAGDEGCRLVCAPRADLPHGVQIRVQPSLATGDSASGTGRQVFSVSIAVAPGVGSITLRLPFELWDETEKIACFSVLASTSGTAPPSFLLRQNAPNPFNPSTAIAYDITSQTPVHVSLAIYTVHGQRVCTLVDQVQAPGEHRVIWDGKDDAGSMASSGIYVCRMAAPGAVQTRRMLLMK